jgi:hypothetical protein
MRAGEPAGKRATNLIGQRYQNSRRPAYTQAGRQLRLAGGQGLEVCVGMRDPTAAPKICRYLDSQPDRLKQPLSMLGWLVPGFFFAAAQFPFSPLARRAPPAEHASQKHWHRLW